MRPNARRIVEALNRRPRGLTRTELGQDTGLSRTTVFSLVQDLVDAGIVVEGPARPTHGRPSKPLLLVPGDGLVVGVDLGRRHLQTAVRKLDGTAVGRAGDSIENLDEEGVSMLPRVLTLIDAALGDHDRTQVRAVGVSVPFAVREDGEPALLTSNAWAVGLASRLSALVMSTWGTDAPPILVGNDANLGALGERVFGVAQQLEHFLYVKASTGLGLGVVTGGRVLRGAHGVAGEWGHTLVDDIAVADGPRLPPPASSCAVCQRWDCLQNLTSFRAVLDQINGARSERDAGAPLREPELIEQLKAYADDMTLLPDDLVNEAFAAAGRRLGYALVDLIRILDPDAVLIGGHLAHAATIVRRSIEAVLTANSLPPAVPVLSLLPAERIAVSEVDGACALAMAHARALHARRLLES